MSFGFGYAAFAAGVVVLSINTRTYRQTASPPEMLSRVMATVRFVSALLVTCVLAWLPVLILWFSPVRRLRDLDDFTR